MHDSLLHLLLYPILGAVSIAAISAWMSPLIISSNSTFTTHMLSHTFFTAYVISHYLYLPPLITQCLLNILVSIALCYTRHSRSVHTAMFSNFVLGLGLLMLAYQPKDFAITLNSIFVPSVLAIRGMDLLLIMLVYICAGFFSYLALSPIICSILEENSTAIYKQVPLNLINLSFHILLGLIVTITSHLVGPLLAFTILVGPGAIAMQWSGRFKHIFILSVLVGLASSIIAFIVSWHCNCQVSICITLLISLQYIFGLWATSY